MTRQRGRPWTPEDDTRLHGLKGEGKTRAQMAAALGRSVPAVGERLRRLGLSRTKVPDWTREEENRLVTLLEAHTPYQEIGCTLGRSREAVVDRCVRLGTSLTRANGLTLSQAAKALGVEQKTVAWWANQRWLKTHPAGVAVSKGPVRMVEYEDLIAFLENEDCWHLWEPERIPDGIVSNGLRVWAVELRRSIRFLLPSEAAERLHVTHYRVNQFIRQGRLRAVRKGGQWLIRSDWVQEPAWRPRWPRTPIRPEEREFVREWWGTQTTAWIGAQLGRPSSSVCAIAYKLGLPRLGRGTYKRRLPSPPRSDPA